MTDVIGTKISKVDSAVSGLSSSPVEEKKIGHRRASSSAGADVFNILDLEKEGKEIKIDPETQKLNWKLNSSPSTVDDKEVLKKPLCIPMVKKIDLVFPLGMEVTARNMKGVTIKDALEAIYKAYKKKEDDELEKPYLAGFEWNKEESWSKLIIHQKATGDAPQGKKGKKKGGDE